MQKQQQQGIQSYFFTNEICKSLTNYITSNLQIKNVVSQKKKFEKMKIYCLKIIQFSEKIEEKNLGLGRIF